MPQFCGGIRIFAGKIRINPYHSNIPHTKHINNARNTILIFIAGTGLIGGVPIVCATYRVTKDAVQMRKFNGLIYILRITFSDTQLCGRCLINMTPVVKVVIHCVFALL